jgi:transcriptional regulator with GAF, ATPase, and Fis domain
MDVANEIQLGKKYSLARAVVQMEDFTAAELTALTGVTPSTVEHFIHTLSKLDQVRKVSLPANGRGRPRKSYRLSEKGKDQLLRYMRQIRLKIESDAVPFPDVELKQLDHLDESVIPQPIVVENPSGHPLYANRAVLDDTGLTLREDREDIEIVGSSEPLRQVLVRVSELAPTDFTVLVLGETGTGKELIARAIHNRSRRSRRPFIRVDCAAIPPSLIASELFGREEGSYAGAIERRRGLFEWADGGTIFLDEVGDLPRETQLALLRVLQEREIERVGGQIVQVDVRVIAATNRNLTSAVVQGKFHPNLLHRLNKVSPIRLPALRERTGDIPLLVGYLIDRYARKMGKKIRNIDKRTMELLSTYDWPGNIRELQNVVERAVILSDDGETFFVDEAWLTRTTPKLGASIPLVVDFERELIVSVLRESHGQVGGPTGAAVRLGITRQTLESKIGKFGISLFADS